MEINDFKNEIIKNILFINYLWININIKEPSIKWKKYTKTLFFYYREYY